MIPQQIVDTLLLGSLVYWLVGFAPTASNFIIYLLSFFLFNFTMIQLFGALSSFSPNKSLYLSASTVTVFANTVLSGYIISPAVFPDYWYWLYWLIPSGWYYRLVVLNQFLSSAYSLDE